MSDSESSSEVYVGFVEYFSNALATERKELDEKRKQLNFLNTCVEALRRRE